MLTDKIKYLTFGRIKLEQNEWEKHENKRTSKTKTV